MSEKTSTPVRVHTHTDLSIIHDARNTRHKSHFFTRKSRRRRERDTEKKTYSVQREKVDFAAERKSFQLPPPLDVTEITKVWLPTGFSPLLYSTKLVKSRLFTTFQVLAKPAASSQVGRE